MEETPQGSGLPTEASLSLLGRVVNLRLQDKEAKGDEKEMVLQRRLYKIGICVCTLDKIPLAF